MKSKKYLLKTKILLLLTVMWLTGAGGAWAKDVTIGNCKLACNKYAATALSADNGGTTSAKTYTAITPTVNETSTTITMIPLGNNYRGDILMGKSSSTTKLFTTDATNDKYMALKFVGTKPSTITITMEYKVSANSNVCTFNSDKFTTVNDGTNDIVYCCFDDASFHTDETAESKSKYGDVVYWRYKISGGTAETYSIDWIATMNEAPTASTVWVDDPSDSSSKIFNATTFTGYSSLLGDEGALKKATANDYIVMNQDEEIDSRLEFAATVTLDGNGKSIIRKSGNTSNLMVLIPTNKNTEIIKNLVIDGNNISSTANAVEVNKQTRFTDCTFKNHVMTGSTNALVFVSNSTAQFAGTTILTNNTVAGTISLKKDRRIDDYDAAFKDADGKNATTSIILLDNFDDSDVVVSNISTTKTQISTSKYSLTAGVWSLASIESGSFQYGLKANLIDTYDVTMSSAGCATVMLPFTADIPNGVKAYKLPAFDGSKSYIMPEEITVDSIVKNTPVYLTGTASTKYTFTKTANTTKAYVATATEGALTGVYTTTTANYNDSNLKSLCCQYVISTDKKGFSRADNSTVSPCNCYVTSTGRALSFVGAGSDNAVPATAQSLRVGMNGYAYPNITASDGSTNKFKPTYSDGVASITMAQNGTSYRGDIIDSESSSHPIFTPTSNDQYLAIKFSGTKPEGTKISFESSSISESTKNTKAIGSDEFSTINDGTNDIVFCKFDYAAGSIYAWQYKISGAASALTYKVDWIATFNDVPTIDMVVKDDPSEINKSYVNATTWTGYDNFLDDNNALVSATTPYSYILWYSGDGVALSSKITTSDVYGLTIDGNGKTLSKASDFTDTYDNMIVCGAADGVWKNITIDGGSPTDSKKDAVMVNKATTFCAVKFQNHNIKSGYGVVKCNSNNATIEGTATFSGNTGDGTNFFLAKDRRLNDNKANFTDGTNTIVPTIALASTYEDGDLLVKNTGTTEQLSTSKYSMTNVGWAIQELNSQNDPYSLKAAFTGAVTQSRSTASGSYGTICLPYDATVTGAVAMEFTGRTSDGMVFTPIGGTTISAGVPYLYRATAASQTFATTGTVYSAANTTDKGFAGSYERKELTAGQYLLSSGVWRFAKASSEDASHTYVYVGAYKCYFPTLPEVGTGFAKAGSVTFGIETDETTGLQQINLNDVKSATDGKYFKNGQLVIMKNGKMYNTAGQEVK